MNVNSYLETVSQWLPLASLIIALIALLLSFLSSRIAKKSYALSIVYPNVKTGNEDK